MCRVRQHTLLASARLPSSGGCASPAGLLHVKVDQPIAILVYILWALQRARNAHRNSKLDSMQVL